jgi:hypothetical protein
MNRNRDSRFGKPDNLKKLLAAGAEAASLGIAVLDSQTRIESVNASLASVSRIAPNDHIGKTPHELVGDVVLPMGKLHERVLSFGQPESLLIKGQVRNTSEFGYWLNHCFPIKDSSGRVLRLGVLAVNVTAENTAVEIFDTLATDSKRLMAEAAGLLNKFDEAIKHYHRSLRESFEALCSPFATPPRRVERFGSSIARLDTEVSTMRELIYEVIAHFSIPEC